MPIHDSGHIEFSINNGYITIVTDEGRQVPAYWAHPRIGNKFSGVCLMHDWWGMDNITRLLANFFAQMGYYVIAPDLFNGETANTPKEAMALVEKTQETRYQVVNASLTVLETHHRTNRKVAAVGVGMGGTLAFESAIKRTDLEAAVAYGGFPQKYLGQFQKAITPILAIYGTNEPYTKPNIIESLKTELSQSAIAEHHQVVMIEGAKHEFFASQPDPAFTEISRTVMNHTLNFLSRYLEKPSEIARPRY